MWFVEIGGERVHTSQIWKNVELDRIPYKQWSSSQLSVAKYYGGITIQDKYYEFDREVNVEMMKDHKKRIEEWVTDGTLSKAYYPDLVHYKKPW
jgi:hypothetical protein